MLKQNLSQKLVQKLSPQQIQLMKLLQVPTASLEQRIKEELESNPALDEGLSDQEEDVIDTRTEDQENDTREEETFELDGYLEAYMEDDPAGYPMAYKRTEDTESHRQIPNALNESFHDFLYQQLGLIDGLSDRAHIVANQIIGSIDDDGYLRRAPLSIVDDLLFTLNIDTNEEEVNSLLSTIKTFDPPGIGAADLQECLILQLDRKINSDTGANASIALAMRILTDYFDQFTKKHYDKLLRLINIEEAELKDAIDEIIKLNPKPASSFRGGAPSSFNYVIPDFIVTNRDNELTLTLNSKNAPDLRVSDQYRDMLKSYSRKKESKNITSKDTDAVVFIKQKIDSARWFIDAIRQRQNTMYNTMYALMQFQRDFFMTGDERSLKPMILKDIAEMTNLDISTISRVANSKYVQTEFGTKRLKDFFSESITTLDGKEVSTLEVKNILNELVSDESKQKPLSDEKLKNALLDRGYDIARRTVAKYREQLNIPVARLRREL